ncbi:GATA transcription factor 29 [Senna tora]|uniref:GATA transcription factor 29 n=1 Tax=Senna tora TaxID=362788 RepID=A0A834SJC7_9FABA|nr:GATA transcription factor 29 [Senna tora]
MLWDLDISEESKYPILDSNLHDVEFNGHLLDNMMSKYLQNDFTQLIPINTSQPPPQNPLHQELVNVENKTQEGSGVIAAATNTTAAESGLKNKRKRKAEGVGKCTHFKCQATETPLWRGGPLGPKNQNTEVPNNSHMEFQGLRKVDDVRSENQHFDLNLMPESDDDNNEPFIISQPHHDHNLTPQVQEVSITSSGLPIVLNSDDGNPTPFNSQINTSSTMEEVHTTPFNSSNDRGRVHSYGSSSIIGGPGKTFRRRHRRSEVNYEDVSRRICTNFSCRTKNTPMWRKGPLGPKTLCNACGIQYKKQVTRRGSNL